MKPNDITRYLAWGAALVACATVLPLQGCDTTVLNVTDPDIILEQNTNSASGALALKNGVLFRLEQTVGGVQGGPEALFMYGALITDEWRSGDTFVQRNNQDQRIWEPQNTFNPGAYRGLNRVRVEGERAIPLLRHWVPDSTYYIGQMFAVTAYVEALIGEHYCNGTPLSDVAGTSVVYGAPLTNDSLYGLAIATSDSAIAEANTSVARGDSALALPPTQTDTAKYRAIRNQGLRIRRLAQVIKGRALLDRAQYAAAAAAVAGVPDTFRYQVTYSTNSASNQIWSLNASAKRYTMVDREGSNGLDFISANDPRVPRQIAAANDLIFDTGFSLPVVREGIWGRSSPITIVSGVEARLIEAENALQTAPGTWLTLINTLRTNAALYPPIQTGFSRGPTLTNLVDPGTQPARVDIMFRERAFWMFSTGHRLGDMRRLVRQYGRDPLTVYPIGGFYKGGVYGDAYMMSVPFDEVNNPNFTQCIDQNP